jgi:hypothetical protein
MATALNFQRKGTSDDYIITLKLPYLFYRGNEIPGDYIQGEISAFWEKDKTGFYKLSNLCTDYEAVWNPYSAGLARICRFLNETVTNDLLVTVIQTDDITGEKTHEKVKKLADVKRKLFFYKDYLYDEDINPKNKYLDCNNLKLYFWEKILTDICEDDVKEIGSGELMLHGINVKLIKSRTKKDTSQEDDISGKSRTVTSNKAKFDVYYSVNRIITNNVGVFFQSIEENGEKQIAVLYHTGSDCGETAQRMKKLEKDSLPYFEDKDEISLEFGSDWKVTTIGPDRVIKDFGNRVPQFLAKYLNVTEKFVRSQRFMTLWNMCKTSR